MGTRLLRFEYDRQECWGIYEEDLRLIEGTFPTLRSILTDGHSQITRAKTEGIIISMEEITLLSPITHDGNIYCQGTNYAEHREEAGFTQQKPAYNLLFMKSPSTLSAANTNIICPQDVQLLDYEIELGLVLKQDITEETNITTQNIGDYIGGLVIANDVSARDIQIVEQQWFKGKSYRTFCPTGPYLYLLEQDEIHYLNDLELILRVNDEVRQHSFSDHLLFKPTDTLTEMSTIFDLRIGDLILTGTPGGVCLRLNKDILEKMIDINTTYEEKINYFVDTQKENGYLLPGDIIELEIRSRDHYIDLGKQRSTVVQSISVNS
ncbi:2-keto-4-pentenoate hydratase/2-oxohepta-3-ene-1,7-dioic acid hydratase (catechol pathway) [Psychrobacillus psychrotolerans]|uniref:2-keto-4-pentenoate hydratase/2-oxohepta-3-ene-1,7-dioic acid hydratase (Catechol pathway) n=1 Tax=Psychrobacillus psychrotolerans TaxID=126156 RepID=A0A1I6B5K2_9BACI|nr:fumarylacetoacetate hydrolase family protein [Psychrobacillus psychrotolerans]SFQ76212.1 2-keto-4-pentenoate hydratase/2-oxohepta-3-ene-1,7-dioic acid hydratase (catechol pathway) [Psychrobacillus psychrotolerans]